MADWRCTVNDLQQALSDYIAIRRGLGFQFRLPASCLRNFVTFLQTEGAPYITTELALRWATQPEKAQPSTWVWRLGMVRRFARWHHAADPRTEIPPETILCHPYHRKTPHIFSDQEITRLLRRAEQLPSSMELRSHTYTTLFGLLAATGMRVNEALGLDRQDVDLQQGILTIRRTKFGKSRHVPVHPSTVQALKKTPTKETGSFLLHERSHSLFPSAALESPIAWLVTPSQRSRNNWESDQRPRGMAAARGYWTCAIDLPLAR